MTDLKFDCLPTIIGSMPHSEPREACSLIRRFLKDLPAWPQLSRRSFRENMYAQYSEGFPGLVIDDEQESIYVDRSRDLNQPLEKLYQAYLDNDITKFPISREYASGLHCFLDSGKLAVRGIKGQTVGPVTWATTVTDTEKKPLIYDETLADAATKLLRLKAAWQEKELKKISPNTIIFVDEPAMSSFGSAFFNVTKEKIVTLLEEVFGGISGIKGIHCCGNTDWSILLATSTNIISFDAYNYGQSLSLYPAEVKKFLNKGNAIAWGIVPNEAELLAKESVPSLRDRLEEAMAPFTRNGISFKQLLHLSLLTPCCGLALLPVDGAARALELLVDLSTDMRQRYL